MKIFVTGTDTDVGKTVISSWLCLHTGYAYFKPIQTGANLDTDSRQVTELIGNHVHKESFIFQKPLSPHLAASIEFKKIDIEQINFPKTSNLIVEGAGGVLVPINEEIFVVDLIKKFTIPVIVVARSTLGTINHTLLTLEALRTRGISILGIILNGPYNEDNVKAIEFYGKVKVLASIPKLKSVTKKHLMRIPFTIELQTLFKII